MTTTLVHQWQGDLIVLSYVISITGSFCTIQLMEQWRLQMSGRRRMLLLMLSSVALGGCGIWAMHFTGMEALTLHCEDGTKLPLEFEGWMTIASLLFPVVGVFGGLIIASKDPFFLEIEQTRRKEIVARDLRDMSITMMLNRDKVARKIKIIALLSHPWRIILGGLFAAIGVLGMHYLGMMGQRTRAVMTFHVGVVAASCIIAWVTATAAFWIIFRVLTFWPYYNSLRVGSALVMGFAICGTHYTGMVAASYEYTEEDHIASTAFLINGTAAFLTAAHGSVLVCFWMLSLSVVTDLRVDALSARSQNITGATGGAQHSVVTPMSTLSKNSSLSRLSPVGPDATDSTEDSMRSHRQKLFGQLKPTRNVSERPREESKHDPLHGVVPGRI